jgi:Domain of Unknown Function (DUF1543)
MQLFAVYLGGRAPRCNTELHDVVFVTGETIEATYEQCFDLWFGAVSRLHLDSYMALDVVDGHRVTLSKEPPADGKALYFINLGGYAEGQFTELHANMIVVAASPAEAKARAKGELMQGGESEVHTDDLYDVDDCLEVSSVGPWHVHLAPTDARTTPKPQNGYHVIPQPVIDAYVAKHPDRA